MDCLFCKIISGEIPSKPVYQDEHCLAFSDIRPVAPTHILVVPREHIASVSDATPGHAAMMGHLLLAAAGIARDKGIQSGYRLVLNTGEDAGQSVEHVHVHLLAGRPMAWPPG